MRQAPQNRICRSGHGKALKCWQPSCTDAELQPLTVILVQGTLAEQSKGICIRCLQSRTCRSGFSTPAALNRRQSCVCTQTSTHLSGLRLVGMQGTKVKRSVVPEPGACSSGSAGHTTQQPSAEGTAEAPGGPAARHAAADTTSR